MMKDTVKVIKIGGNVIDNSEALSAFLLEFADMPGPKVLVHGGGKEATRLCNSMSIPTRMIDGRRVTDAETLDVVTMVYAGLINKRIVAGLQRAGCNAIGLTGADAGCIRAVRRSPVPVDYGFVGDIPCNGVDPERILNFVHCGLTPVFCAITHDGNGTLLNCNADSVATAIATALAAAEPTELIFCFEKNGVLADVDNPGSVIDVITPSTYFTLRSRGAVGGGMIPKVENALKAIAAGVRSVTIRNSNNISTPAGTTIKP